MGLGAPIAEGGRQRVTVLDAGLEDLAGDVLRDFGRLRKGPPLGDKSRDIRAGRQVSAAGERLDIEVNESLVNVLANSVSSVHR
jgi:hypothetical protein